ncbi:MAG: hypothetical protein HZB91_04965 [Elusimicrobia bacterium]|nr:hypothetical protein [Elusimicrobiota bacterium]
MLEWRRQTWLVFAGVLAVHAAANAVWLRQNRERCAGFPFHLRHFVPAMDQYGDLKKGTPLPVFIKTLNEDVWRPAPLHSFCTAIGLLLSGKDIVLVTWVLNMVYLAIALLGVLALAGELGYPPEVGISAMVLLSLYPAVYGLSRLYGAFDFQVMAVMPAAVWAALRTDGYASRRACLVLAAGAAAGLLLKDTFAAYFLPVFLATAAASLAKSFDKRKLVNMGLVVLVTGALVFFYYSAPVIMRKGLTGFLHEAAGPWHEFRAWKVYTLGLSETLMSPPFLLLFLCSLAWFLLRERRGPGFWAISAWISAPWALIFFMPHFKQPSYFVPILPAAAIVSAAALSRLPRGPVRVLLPVLAGVGMIQFLAFSFGVGDGLGRLRRLRLLRLTNGYEMTYFKPDPGIVYHRGDAVPFDLYRAVAARVAAMGPGPGMKERVLVLQSPGGIHEYHHAYDLLDFLHGWRFETTGTFGGILRGDFLDGSYDRVIVPMKDGWDIRRYVDAVYADSMFVARETNPSWTPEYKASVEAADPVGLAERLERFLAPFTVKERLGTDGESDLWLFSRPGRS